MKIRQIMRHLYEITEKDGTVYNYRLSRDGSFLITKGPKAEQDIAGFKKQPPIVIKWSDGTFTEFYPKNRQPNIETVNPPY